MTMVAFWAVWQLAIVAVPLLGLYFAWRFLRAYETRNASARLSGTMEERLLRLEEEVQSISNRQQHAAEEQRFLTDLLADRKGDATTPTP